MTAARNKRGSAAADVVIAAGIMIFVLAPVFSLVMEKYVLSIKTGIIRDALDMTNIAACNALKTGELGKARVEADRADVVKIFEELLCLNMNLEKGLIPGKNSIAEGPVVIKSVEIYLDGLPAVCPGGTVVAKPAVHSSISVPIKPSLYRKLMLKLQGKDFIVLTVHVDSEIPVNN